MLSDTEKFVLDTHNFMIFFAFEIRMQIVFGQELNKKKTVELATEQIIVIHGIKKYQKVAIFTIRMKKKRVARSFNCTNNNNNKMWVKFIF